MARTRIKESVTPTGVPFTVRSLIGKDQENLTEVNQNGTQAEKSNINKMMADCLLRLGGKGETEITTKFVGNLLSNDRKFILVTLRQHTLKYRKLFDFKYEWPLESGKRDKDVQDYSVNFTAENFPVVPYWWVSEFIEEKRKEDTEYVKPDGHDVLFPVMFESYSDMLEQHQVVEGEFEDGVKYQWKMMDGSNEKNIASLKKVNINTPIAQRSPKYLFGEMNDQDNKKEKDPVWTRLNTSEADAMDLEHLRGEILKKEGNVDTGLTIQNQNDKTKEIKVDLIQIPAFFFPSMGQ